MKIDFRQYSKEELREARKVFRGAWGERFNPRDRHDRWALFEILQQTRSDVAAAIADLTSTTNPPPPAA